MMYGYIRVSTREQNEVRQWIALREAGVPEANIFMDKQSGGDFNRPQYKKMVRRLRHNDLICIKSIDRLGRNGGLALAFKALTPMVYRTAIDEIFHYSRSLYAGREGQPAAPQLEKPAVAETRVERPQSAAQPKPRVNEDAGCRPAGGAELFMKLASLLPESDRLAVSAALLDAALVRGDKGREIEFEREMPARNFLSVAHNRKELCAAAAKLWNIEGAADAQLTEAVRAEPEPAPAAAQPEPKPQPREEARPAQPSSGAPLSAILRKAGAELLYVRSADMSDEETPEGNE